MKVLSMILSLLIVTSVATAGDVEKKFVKGEFLKKELNLTDEQLEKVREIRKGGKDEMKADWKNFRALKKDFREGMKNPKISNQELQTKFESFQKARDTFQRKRFEMILKMREILSPDQLEKFLELKKKHKGKWKKQKAEKK